MCAAAPVDAATFDERVLRSPVPVVVDFWAPWCRPCDRIEPILTRLAERAGERALFVRLDVDAHPEPAARFGVLSLPTVILFVGGRPRATVVGVRDERHFARTFGPWLEPAPGA